MAQNDKSRSSFVYKLHELLSAEQHPDWLRWISNDTFGITSIESQAKAALSPQWEFRSLASFIRQLSYYSFKRLSDRRRSAERRSHSPALIVFTHASGNFVRDDINKTLQIPRKLRSRKKTGNGARRKSSTTSSAAFDYDYPERSPTPESPPCPVHYENELPTQTHLTLSTYQLPPWTAINDVNASSPRSLSLPSADTDRLQSFGLSQNRTPYEPLPADLSRNYPSPTSGPSSYTYESPCSPQPAAYRSQYLQQSSYQQAQPSYFYSPPQVYTTPASYATNELPPIRTITSGLVAPLSPPPEEYTHYSPPPPHAPSAHPGPRRASQVYVHDVDGSASSPAAPLPPLPTGLVAMQQVDTSGYYPSSSPSRPTGLVEPAQVSHQQHVYYPSSSNFACGSQLSSFNATRPRSDYVYSTAAYH
ncbi:uncharacterized protein JCM15063_005082 [Sporobolomyces koalae]|uniref:uncharacterized protein n=1 Tax=Sporobolomyces koalae TaxID=500713 RepID=UPI00317225BC